MRLYLADAGAGEAERHASVWEMHLKHHAGKLNLPDPPRQWIPQQMAAWNREWQIRLAAIQRTSDLPDLHRDPFDRLLVAQALEDGLAIVSPDPFFPGYGVTVVWWRCEGESAIQTSVSHEI